MNTIWRSNERATRNLLFAKNDFNVGAVAAGRLAIKFICFLRHHFIIDNAGILPPLACRGSPSLLAFSIVPFIRVFNRDAMIVPRVCRRSPA